MHEIIESVGRCTCGEFLELHVRCEDCGCLEGCERHADGCEAKAEIERGLWGALNPHACPGERLQVPCGAPLCDKCKLCDACDEERAEFLISDKAREYEDDFDRNACPGCGRYTCREACA